MVSASNLQNLFDRKIFEEFGLSATWYQKTNSSEWGDADDPGYDGGTSITVVPYDTFSERMGMEQVGQIESGQTNIAVKYDVAVSQDDKIAFNGDEYEVQEIEDNLLSGTNLIKIVSASKIA